MAHTCPDCDCLCHCNGDIDDIDMGYDIKCIHWMKPECEGNPDRDDNDVDDIFDDEYYEEWKKFDHIPAEGGKTENK